MTNKYIHRFIGYLIGTLIIVSVGAQSVSTQDTNTQSIPDTADAIIGSTIDYIDFSGNSSWNGTGNFSYIEFNDTFIPRKTIPTQIPLLPGQTLIPRDPTIPLPTHIPHLEAPSDSESADSELWPVYLFIIVFICCAILAIVWSVIRYKSIKKDEKEAEERRNKDPSMTTPPPPPPATGSGGMPKVKSKVETLVKIPPKGETATNTAPPKGEGLAKVPSKGENVPKVSPKVEDVAKAPPKGESVTKVPSKGEGVAKMPSTGETGASNSSNSDESLKALSKDSQ